MDEEQAEAAAHAILGPGRQAQEEPRHKKVKVMTHARREQRLVGGFGLLGLVVAAAMAFFMHKNALAFGGIGAPMGVVVGRLIVSWSRLVSPRNYSIKRTQTERATQAVENL